MRLLLPSLTLPILLASGLSSVHPARSASAQPLLRPNILIVMTDDQRAGGTMNVMPKTREWFGESGTRFTRAFVSTPTCCPARASIYTGRYTHNHGVRTNRSIDELDHGSTLQRYLQRAGYRTAFAGKFFNFWDLELSPPYFDRWAVFKGTRYYDVRVNADGSQERVPDYITTFVARYATDLIRDDFENDDLAPWLLYVAPLAPHMRATPEPRYRGAPVGRWRGNPAVRERDERDKPRYVRRIDHEIAEARRIRTRQLRTLLSVDDLVDEVFRTLEDTGELSNTLAFFVSDNGFMWAEHGLLGKSVPYTEAIRVPMMMRRPGLEAVPARDDRLASLVDIAPTALEAAGVVPDREFPIDGRSLLQPDERGFLLVENDARRWASIRTRRYQYIEHFQRDGTGTTFSEYYDLRRDPWQLVNLFRDGDRTNDPDWQPLHRRLRRATACAGTEPAGNCP
ncbi:MAG TPA: sulfatase [Actinomycetota bacterium]|nr:sulfatase [Actinomycetota bacterium]